MPPALTWLVRHGQSASNAGLPAVGAENVPLTELGHRQARALAARVDRQPDLLIVSPFIPADQHGALQERLASARLAFEKTLRQKPKKPRKPISND